MQQQSEIIKAFQMSGVHSRDAIFFRAIARFLNNGGNIERARDLLDEAAKRMSGEGHTGPAIKGHCPLSNAAQPDDCAEGHGMVADMANVSVPSAQSTKRNREGQLPTAVKAMTPVPTPVSPSYIAAARAGAAKVALTVLDSFKVRDGRAIGDLIFSELETMRFDNAREAAVIRQIQRHAANVAGNAKVRDVINPDILNRMVQRAAEAAEI